MKNEPDIKQIRKYVFIIVKGFISFRILKCFIRRRNTFIKKQTDKILSGKS